MNSFRTGLGHFLRRPEVTIGLGVLVCLSGLSEIMEEIIEGYESSIRGVHGVLAFGVITLLKGLTELVEGFELVTIEIEDVERQESEAAHSIEQTHQNTANDPSDRSTSV